MEVIILVGCVAALLVAIGALVGSEFQIRLQDDQRRRMAARIRELNEVHRAMLRSGVIDEQARQRSRQEL